MYSWNTERDSMHHCRGILHSILDVWAGRTLAGKKHKKGRLYIPCPYPTAGTRAHLSPAQGCPCKGSTWLGLARRNRCFWEIYCIFSLLPKLRHTQTQRKGHVSLKSWRGIFVTLQGHGHLAPGQLLADGIVFQLVFPKWIREPQKPRHRQHPGTNSPPRQEVAQSILPGLILEGVHLLSQPWKGNFAMQKCFYSVCIASPAWSVHTFFQWMTWGRQICKQEMYPDRWEFEQQLLGGRSTSVSITPSHGHR